MKNYLKATEASTQMCFSCFYPSFPLFNYTQTHKVKQGPGTDSDAFMSNSKFHLWILSQILFFVAPMPSVLSSNVSLKYLMKVKASSITQILKMDREGMESAANLFKNPGCSWRVGSVSKLEI